MYRSSASNRLAAHTDGIALLRAQRQTRADRKDLGAEPEQPARVVGDERANLLDLRLRFENVDLVDDDDDLLAPAADLLEKRALGFGEGPIGRRHEQDQVGSRYELGRDRFVLADDGVGARRVDDVDLAEDLGRCGDDVQRGLRARVDRACRRTGAR